VKYYFSKISLDNLKKLEKMLTHIGVTDLVLGKKCLADLAVLNMYCMFTDKSVNCEEDFKTHAPTAMKIVEKCKTDPKITEAMNDAKCRPFFPFQKISKM